MLLASQPMTTRTDPAMVPETSFLTVPELATRLQRSSSTIHTQIKLGTLAARKIGRDWFIEVREAERYEREHRSSKP